MNYYFVNLCVCVCVHVFNVSIWAAIGVSNMSIGIIYLYWITLCFLNAQITKNVYLVVNKAR